MAEERSAAATFTQAAGIVTGLAGVGLSLLTFSSALLKLLVLVVFCRRAWSCSRPPATGNAAC